MTYSFMGPWVLLSEISCPFFYYLMNLERDHDTGSNELRKDESFLVIGSIVLEDTMIGRDMRRIRYYEQEYLGI